MANYLKALLITLALPAVLWAGDAPWGDVPSKYWIDAPSPMQKLRVQAADSASRGEVFKTARTFKMLP